MLCDAARRTASRGVLVRSAIMRRAVCPGSFDPVTNGHLDIISRAGRLYGEVTTSYPNVRVESFHGLLVDFCKANDCSVIVKGLRAVSDFDYELQMAQMNLGLASVETLFMTTNPLYSFLSSSLIKDVETWGGDVSAHGPEVVAARLRQRLADGST